MHKPPPDKNGPKDRNKRIIDAMRGRYWPGCDLPDGLTAEEALWYGPDAVQCSRCDAMLTEIDAERAVDFNRQWPICVPCQHAHDFDAPWPTGTDGPQ